MEAGTQHFSDWFGGRLSWRTGTLGLAFIGQRHRGVQKKRRQWIRLRVARSKNHARMVVAVGRPDADTAAHRPPTWESAGDARAP